MSFGDDTLHPDNEEEELKKFIKVLRLQPGDILVLHPEIHPHTIDTLTSSRLGIDFRVPIVIGDPEHFTVIRQPGDA